MFQSDQLECNIQVSEIFIIFVGLSSPNKNIFQVNSSSLCCNFRTQNKKTLLPVIHGFWCKKGQNGSCEVHFHIPPLQALNLPPLAQEVDLLPTRAEIYNINCVCFGFMLHCHTSTTTVHNDHWYSNEDSVTQPSIMWMVHCTGEWYIIKACNI